MRAILEFDLPEENEEFEVASKGFHYKIVIDDVLNEIRKSLKYKDLSEETSKELEELRSFICNELNDRKL